MNAFARLNIVFLALFTLLNIWFLSFTFLSQEISQFEVYTVYAFIALSIYLLILFFLDVRNPEKSKKKSKTGIPTVTLNQALRGTDEAS